MSNTPEKAAPTGLYTIEGFNSEPGQGRSGYGFSIILSAPVAAALIAMPREQPAPFEADILQRLRRSISGDYARGLARVDYFGETWLLGGFTVGSDCACFHLDYSTARGIKEGHLRDLRYGPHNIDTREQASAILSTWLMWFNTLSSVAGFRQPFAI
jgi:hypothetical protein